MAGNTVEVTDATFEEKVLQSDKLVMVDFWAPWCGPCRAVAPILEELANEYEGQIMIAKVNTDKDPRYASEFGVMAIPNLIFFKDGQMVDQIVGAGPKRMYQQRLNALLQSNGSANN